MNPDVLLMTALAVMWAALVVLTWIVWRLHCRLAELEALPEPLRVVDIATVDDATWAAVTDALDCCTDMEGTPS